MVTITLRGNVLMGAVILLVGALCLPSNSLADLDSGLVAYWSFDEGSGDTAYDYSGYNNHGMIYGASWTGGIRGSALYFEGEEDYVSVSPLLTEDSAGTISLWFRSDEEITTSTLLELFVIKGSVDGTPQILVLLGNVTSLIPGEIFGVMGDGDYRSACSTSQLPSISPEWHHFVVISDSSGHSYCLDNTEYVPDLFYGGWSALTNFFPISGATEAWIGHKPPSGGYEWEETVIDEVRIYDRVLSEAEIESLYTIENYPPTAIIDSITPNPADSGEVVTFVGHGEDADGYIVSHEWISDLDGLLSEDSSFTTDSLSTGVHTITFRVQDNDSLWSFFASEFLGVGTPSDQLDQQQTEEYSDACSYPPYKLAQTFKPSLNMLTRVELRVDKIGDPSDSIIMTIRGSLFGDDLTSASIHSDDLPAGLSWVQFDFPNIQVIPEEEYCIVWHPGNFDQSNRVCWRGAAYNPYPRGEAWIYLPDDVSWARIATPNDLCFKTYGYDAALPTAIIDSITPNPADTGELVTFVGHGEVAEGSVIGYEWASDIHGFLGEDSSYSTFTLSMGMHYINFRVQDDDSLWSADVSDTVAVGVVPDQVDEQQTDEYDDACAYPTYKLAQTFKPSRNMLTRVETRVDKIGDPSDSIIITIRGSLFGDDLTSASIHSDDLPAGLSWVQFDFPNIQVIPEEEYCIVWHPGNFDQSNRVCWRGAAYNPYPRGEAWIYKPNDVEWQRLATLNDLCFKTYGYDAALPTAIIDSITPNPADTGELVTFVGHGEIAEGFLIGYDWMSDLDGSLSTDSFFSSPALTGGIHYISFRVQGDDSLWSTVALDILAVGECPDRLDQQQTEEYSDACAYPSYKLAQTFKPSLDTLSRVELKVDKIGGPSDSIIITIRGSLSGDDLTSASIHSDCLPAGLSWVQFDFPNIQVIPEEEYCIVWHPGNFDQSNRVCWRGAAYNPYPGGEAWLYRPGPAEWARLGTPDDFCFKTYGYPLVRGDVNGDGVIDIGDVIYLINYLFTGTSPPDPLWVGDCNCDGIVDIGDVIYLINYLFTGTSPPGC